MYGLGARSVLSGTVRPACPGSSRCTAAVWNLRPMGSRNMSAARRKWSSWTTTGALVAATLTVLPHAAEAALESTPGSSGDSTRVRPARTVHEILTSEFGVNRPTGLTYDPDRRTLLLTGDLPQGGSEIVAVTPTEKPRGRQVNRALDDGGTAAFDPRTDQLRTRTAGIVDPAGS